MNKLILLGIIILIPSSVLTYLIYSQSPPVPTIISPTSVTLVPSSTLIPSPTTRPTIRPTRIPTKIPLPSSTPVPPNPESQYQLHSQSGSLKVIFNQTVSCSGFKRVTIKSKAGAKVLQNYSSDNDYSTSTGSELSFGSLVPGPYDLYIEYCIGDNSGTKSTGSGTTISPTQLSTITVDLN